MTEGEYQGMMFRLRQIGENDAADLIVTLLNKLATERETRNAALEEAAKVAETMGGLGKPELCGAECCYAEATAAAIRALKDKP